MGVNGEALQLHAVYKKLYFVLQVTRESISGTTSHVRASECAMKLKDKIIITIVQSYTGINITRLLPLALLLVLRTPNNTDGNKLVIFSGIALYYGDISENSCGLIMRIIINKMSMNIIMGGSDN